MLLEPLGTTGEAVYPAFEGFGPLKDGTNALLLGYFNRNKEAVDVPIGPDNRIEPGGPDFGQPTHFLSGRQWGMFAITVPKDFGTKKLTWTLTANGHTSAVHVLDQSAVLDRLLQEHRERQRAAAHQVQPDGTRVHRPAAREVRADADRHGRHSRSI